MRRRIAPYACWASLAAAVATRNRRRSFLEEKEPGFHPGYACLMLLRDRLIYHARQGDALTLFDVDNQRRNSWTL
jgi:hypothetical protein